MGTITEKLQKVLGTKLAIRQAIVSMGQTVAETEPFAAYADKIRAIRTGVETGDATAGAGDILLGKTAYVKGQKVTGTIQSQAAKTVTPGTSAQTAVEAGRYTTGAVTVAGDVNLVASNIKDGAYIFGVRGSLLAAVAEPTVLVTITNNKQSTSGTSGMRAIAYYLNEYGRELSVYIYQQSSVSIYVRQGSVLRVDKGNQDTVRILSNGAGTYSGKFAHIEQSGTVTLA